MLRGRTRELRLAARAIAARTPLIFHGEAGIGKTAVLHTVARQYAPAFVGGGLPSLSFKDYLPLARAVRDDIPQQPTDAVDKVARTVGDGVLIIDDLQWADDATLRILPRLASRLRVLGSIRRGGPPGEARALAAATASGARIVELHGLEDDDLALVLHDHDPLIGDDEVARAVQRCGGNPLIAMELARAGDVPEHLAKAIAVTLEQLSSSARSALALLTLFARPVSVESVGTGIDELEHEGLVTTRGSQVAIGHRLLGELWVEQLSDAERRELHRQIAGLTSDPGEAAHHLAAAGDSARAAAFALEAARMATSPNERARYLEFAANTGQVECRERIDAGWALLDVDDPIAAQRVLADAKASEPRSAVELQLLRCLAHSRSGDAVAARDSAQSALETQPSSDVADLIDRVRLEHAALSVWPYWEPESALDALVRGAPGGVRHDVIATVARLQLGAPDVEEDLRAAVDGADSRSAALAAISLAFTDDAYRPLLGTMRTLPDAPIETASLVALAELVLAVHCGDIESTAVELATLLDQPRLGDVEVARAHLALALADAGATGEALAALQPTDHRATPTGTATLAWARAETELTAGRLRRAARAAAECIAGCPHRFPVAQLAELTAAWIAFESGTLVPGRARLATIAAAESEHTGVAALAAGDFDGAEKSFAAAAAAWRPRNARSALRCRWASAESLRRGGNCDRAVVELTRLEAEADASGRRPLTAKVRASLRAAGVRRTPRRGPTAHGLTPREREILTLVGAGRSSRQIGQELGVAASTVDTHVESAVRKLGARSRRQAAAIVLDDGSA